MKRFILISILLTICVVVFPNVGHTIGFEGFGGKLGLVLPDVGDNTIGFGAIGDLGTILPTLNALKAEASAEYWGNSYDYFGGKSKLSVISVNGTAKYYFTGSGISPFAGAGLGLVLSRASVEFDQPVFGVSDSSDTDTDIGINLVGGVDIPIGIGMKFVAEGKFSTAGGDWFQITGGIVVRLK